MTDILDDYLEWRADQESRIGTHGDRCHMWPRHERCMIHRLAAALASARLTDRCMIHRLAAALASARLTDEERSVLREVRDSIADRDGMAANEQAAAIDALLERLKMVPMPISLGHHADE